MMLLGMINYAYTWYDPAATVKPQALARVATDLFLNGFLSSPQAATKHNTARRNA